MGKLSCSQLHGYIICNGLMMYNNLIISIQMMKLPVLNSDAAY